MLQRLISIKNVGRFRNCAAVGDVTFKRFTLIFAENGRGKTTLCAILRSLFTNTPALIIGRTTLGSMERPEVQLLTANGNIAFRNGAWSVGFPDIAIFDGTYVSENVFAGDVVVADHRRNLYRVIIGAEGVTLASRLNGLDEESRAKNTGIRDNRITLQRHVPTGVTVEGFIALVEDAEINAKIGAKEQELQAVQRAAQLQQRAGLTAVAVPVFPSVFAELLAKTFANVSVDAERRVGEHIARHQMQARGETWLTEGLRYVAGEECPFCGQGLADVDLIEVYRSFFSKEYHALRDEVTNLSGQVEEEIGDRIAAAIDQIVLQNNNSSEFWRQYCEITPPVAPEEGRESINRYLERINAGFRITTPTHTYRGGAPSSSYQILINQNAVDLGGAATPADRPSFKNTLSAGDRSTLALAFFLAQLEQDANRARKVVVFDDPFTTLDSFRRNHTVYQVQRCGETCAQVILLSHEASFLHLLWDGIPPGDRKAIQLARVGEENTTIAEWNIEKAVQARYRADLETLQRFFSLGDGERRDVIQKIRPVLEGYCRNLYPAQFGEQEMMGSIVGKIRAAGAAHPLHPIVEDLEELNMYCRRYHHGENPHAATEPVDDAELQGYVKRTLKLVGCLL